MTDVSPRGDHDELVLTISPGWRPREGRARIFYRTVRKRDLTDLARLAAQTALSEAILFEVSASALGTFPVPASVQFVPTAELIERLEDSAAIRWDDTAPKVDRRLLARLRAVDQAPPWADQLGIRALPVLARNKIPPGWASVREPPDELFERLTFRLLTAVFRFQGTDLGATARAERQPDALLESPALAPTRFSAVLDCKASRDGWRMDADDETRLINYVDARRTDLSQADEPFLVVVSSNFSTGPTAYARRRDAIRERCGARLVYLRASYLASAALAVEIDRLSPSDREHLPWEAYFAQGCPTGAIATSISSGART